MQGKKIQRYRHRTCLVAVLADIWEVHRGGRDSELSAASRGQDTDSAEAGGCGDCARDPTEQLHGGPAHQHHHG